MKCVWKVLAAIGLLSTGVIAEAQTFTSSVISAQNLLNTDKTPLKGTVVVTLTDGSNNPVTYTPQGGSPSTAPFVANVVNGKIQAVNGFPFAVPGAATTTPAPIFYRIQTINSNSVVVWTLPLTQIAVQYYSIDGYIAQANNPINGSGAPTIPHCAPGAQYTDTTASTVPWACTKITYPDASTVWTQNPSQNAQCTGQAIADPAVGAPYCMESWRAYVLPAYQIGNGGTIPSPAVATPVVIPAVLAPGGTTGEYQINGTGNVFAGVNPVNCSVYSSPTACLAATTQGITVPPGMTGTTPQYNYSQATATCTVNTVSGALNIFFTSPGSGYTTFPTITYNSLVNPPGNIGPISGSVSSTGFLVLAQPSSSGWSGGPNGNNGQCPVVFTVPAPTTQPAVQSVLNLNNGVTAYQTSFRPEDFGAAGDGTTDDTAAFNNAVTYATLQGTRIGTVELTAGKSYYFGNTIAGTYAGGGDDGTVPIAATLTITAPSTCVVSNAGQGLTTDNLTYTTTGSGTISGISLNTSTHQLNSTCSVSGATQNTTVYAGPTCGGTPCTTLAPIVPAQIPYNVRLYSNLTVNCNGAYIVGGFTGSAMTAASYGYAWPYTALFGSPSGQEPVSHVDFQNCNFYNAFIGFGNVGSYWNVTDQTMYGALLAQGQNSQYSLWRNINVKGQFATFANFYFGGQNIYRAPETGVNSYNVLNDYNLIDALQIEHMAQYAYGFSNLTTWNTVRHAWDCYVDQTWAQIEVRGITNSDQCFTPPGSSDYFHPVVRMPDQDFAQQSPPDSMYRGSFGVTVAGYTYYGRPTNGVFLQDIITKQTNSYAVVVGPNNNNIQGNVVGVEGGDVCNGEQGVVWGSVQCPNPFEPQNTNLPGVVLVSEPGSWTNVEPDTTYLGTVVFPWQNQILPLYEQARSLPFVGGSSHSSVTTSNPIQIPGQNQNLGFALGANRQNTQLLGGTLPGNSQIGQIGGFTYNQGVNQTNTRTWILQDLEDVYAPAAPSGSTPGAAHGSVLYWGDYFQQPGNQTSNDATFWVPGLKVQPNHPRGGNVTNFNITTSGTGYGNSVSVPCVVGISPGYTIGSTSIKLQSDCAAKANSSGQILVGSVTCVNCAAGYTTNPPVTFSPPGAAIFQCSSSGGVPTGTCNAQSYGLNLTTNTAVEPAGLGVTTSTTYTPGSLVNGQVTTLTTSGGSTYPNSWMVYVGSNGGTQAVGTTSCDAAGTLQTTAGAQSCSFDGDTQLNHLAVCTATVAASGSVTSKTKTTIAGVNCPGVTYTTDVRADALVPINNASGVSLGDLNLTAVATQNNTVNLTFYNPTANTLNYPAGQYVFEVMSADYQNAGILNPGASTGQTVTNNIAWLAGGTGSVTSFAAPSGSWPSWLVPTVTNSTTTPSLAVASSVIPVAAGGTGTATPSLVAGTNIGITGTWPNQTISTSGGGTVTSVSLVGSNNLFSSTAGTPLTTAGSLNVDSQLANQTANTALMGPSSGSAAQPTFRNWVNADFPSSLSPSITGLNLSGTFGLTNSPTFTSGQMNIYNETLLNGCNPTTEYQYGAGAGKYANIGLVSCLTTPNSGVNYQQNAMYGWVVNNSAGYPESVAISGGCRNAANGGVCYGANFLVNDVTGLTSGLVDVGAEFDIGGQNATTAYSGGYGVNVELYETGHTGTYPFTGFNLQGNAGALFSQGFNIASSTLCSTCPAFNVGSLIPATSGANSSTPPLDVDHMAYWNGTASTDAHFTHQAVIGTGTTPLIEYRTTVTAPGASYVDYQNGIKLGLYHSDNSTLDLIAGSSGTGTIYTDTLPGATGTFAVYTGTPVNTHCVDFAVTGGIVTLTDSGSTCNAGAGTVTSVALSGSGIVFSSTSGTPVTTSGTLNADLQLATQSANTFLAGPSSGSAATPSFRQFVNADFPSSLAPTFSAANLTNLPSVGISGLTSGYIPLAGSATTITSNSPINYNVTNSGYLTSTKPFIIADTTDAGLIGLSANGVAPAVRTGTAAWGIGSSLGTAGTYLFPNAPGTGVWTGTNSSGVVTNTFTPIQGTDTSVLSAGSVSGTGSTLCTDANGGATTTGCSSGGVSSLTLGTNPYLSSSGTTGAITLSAATVAASSILCNASGSAAVPTACTTLPSTLINGSLGVSSVNAYSGSTYMSETLGGVASPTIFQRNTSGDSTTAVAITENSSGDILDLEKSGGVVSGFTSTGFRFGVVGTAISTTGTNITVAPTSPVTHFTGTGSVQLMTAPSGCTTSAHSCEVTIIPDGAFTTTTGGTSSGSNYAFAIASTAVVGKVMIFRADPATSLWYPSY